MGCGHSRKNQSIHASQPNMSHELKQEIDPSLQLELREQSEDISGNIVDNFAIPEEERVDDQFLSQLSHMPINPPAFKNEMPDTAMKPKHVYGFNQGRSNLFYMNDSIIYPSASFIVQLDPYSNTQSYLTSKEPSYITAVAVHNDTIAFSEAGQNPKICIYTSNVREAYVGKNRKAVSSMWFSPHGKYLAMADMHSYHYVSVWDAEALTMLAEQRGSQLKILEVKWSISNSFVSVGLEVQFWAFEDGLLYHKNADFGKETPPIATVCADSLSETHFLTGGSNGKIYEWSEATLLRSHSAHKGAVQCLRVFSNMVVSAGKDGKLFVYSLHMDKQREIPVLARSIDARNDSLLVGTLQGKIIQIEINGQSKTLSEFPGEITAIGTDRDYVITCGKDKKLRVWDIYSKKCVNSVNLSDRAKALAINPTSRYVTIGSIQGTVTVRANCEQLDSTIASWNIAGQCIEVLRYSSEGSKLAVGTREGLIYIYATDTFKEIHCFHQRSTILSLDWSSDCSILQSSSSSIELLYWSVSEGKKVDPPSRAKWSTWTSKFGWAVQCLHSSNCVYQFKDLVAAGSGDLKIYGFPHSEDAIGEVLKGQCVNKMAWTEKGLFTGGGEALVHWS